MNVGFVHLGCSKNLIDTESTIGLFKDHNFKIVNNEKDADIIVINTCGFIGPAKEEAINTILEMSEYKNERCKYLIVMGCLVQRYYHELIKALPEVDLFIKIQDYNNLWKKIEDLIKNDIVEIDDQKEETKITKVPKMPMLDQALFLNRVITTGKNFAYLKIGEGCSNRCTYCAIPYIRGPFVSRKKEDIIKEAKELVKKGIKEIIIIAQDTTKYGVDLYGEEKLTELLEDISKIKGLKWIRFLYSYPEGITDKLLETVKNNPKIVEYFDIPIQHISNSLLKKMNRKTNRKEVLDLINKIRNKIPDATLRTSLIVGFPGETNEQFEELLEFIKEVKFDKLGVFMYSKEDGTPAARLPEQIHGNTKKSRYNKIMKAQQEISNKKLQEKLGKKYEVLIEDISFDGKYYIGRTKQDVPEIDGIIYIKNKDTKKEKLLVNKFVTCEITSVNNNYDLNGIIV